MSELNKDHQRLPLNLCSYGLHILHNAFKNDRVKASGPSFALVLKDDALSVLTMEGTLDTGKLHKDLFKDKNSISLGHSADSDIKSLQQAKSDSERDDDILGISIVFSQIRHGHHLKDHGQEPLGF
ncbi:hypothetical protein RRG08_048876 [Elysia crispata]|uniref:Uncharacterized protein n=1 Tax=Elysia crispata TaxID=231223 RepID=A0AAE0YTM6_9GAST|nr:hypothetical protein RRG08_048876 [Elysia crispata]